MAHVLDRNHPAVIEEPETPNEPLPNAPVEISPADEEVIDAREATELELIDDRVLHNHGRTSAARRAESSRNPASTKPDTFVKSFRYGLSRFWRHQISVTVPHEACRDHLALERTFLGYLRTSLALSMIGITIAQLFRLQHSPKPNSLFGFYVLGKPLACICQGSAIYTLMIGAFRTWRSQNAFVRGKAITGGFEIVLLAGGVFIILLLFFVLLIAVDVTKEDVASK